jgi:hypothetical protein
VTWTENAAGLGTTTNWNSICWSETLQKFCIVGSVGDGSSAISTDATGTSFTVSASLNIVAAGTTPKVAYSDTLGLFIAVGGSSLIATSSDGLTWTDESQPSGGPGSLRAVAVGFDPNTLIAHFSDDNGLNATLTQDTALDLSATITDDNGLEVFIWVTTGDLVAEITSEAELFGVLDEVDIPPPVQTVLVIV